MAGDRLARGPGTWTGGPRARRGLSLRVRLSSSVVCRLPAELLGLASKDVSLTVAWRKRVQLTLGDLRDAQDP